MTSNSPNSPNLDASRAFELFDELVELSAAERAIRLAEIRVESAGVAAELEALLAADEAADDFLEQPASDTAAAILGQAAERTIGPWRIVDLLGRGGMGVVYRVERADDQFRQDAALKLVPRALDDDSNRRRFLAERQILARLQHPRIAALLDGGVTEDGQPYFAMELAEGPDLISHCDQKRLDIDERLQLFLQVCEGVQHAHRNLVVHRDLKPSNIVVTDNGVKLLDFGIAKLLAPEDGAQPAAADLTRTGSRLLTPSYAAPEQVLGEAITTSTDVYGLGLVLYEMLCGRSAHGLHGDETAAQIERRICEVEVRRPSQSLDDTDRESARAAARRSTPERLRRRLRGDLDLIAAKALSKDPRRRYESVQALADDVQRHLGSLPIEARPPSWHYRSARFVRRNALLVGAGTVIGVLLSTLFVSQLQSAREIRQALETSRIEAAKARETADFLSGLFEVADPAVSSGRDVSARELLDRGAARIRGDLDDQPEVQAALMGEIGWIYHRLGLADEAAQILAEAISIQTFAAGGGAGPERATNQHRLSIVEDHRGNMEAATALAREALENRRAQLPEGHPDIAESMGQLGSVLAFMGEYEQAEPLAREAVNRLVASVGFEDGRTTTAQHNLAWLLRRIGGEAEAIELYERVLTVDEPRLGPDHPDILYTMNALAVALRRSGRPLEAERLYVEILERRRRILAPEHPDIAAALHNLARAQAALGHLEAAAASFEEAIEIWGHSLPPDHANFGTAFCSLGDLEAQRGFPEQALDRLLRGLGILEARLPPAHPRVIDCIIRTVELSLDTGRSEQATKLIRQGLGALILDAGAPLEQTLRRARLQVLQWIAIQGDAPGRPEGGPIAMVEDALDLLRQHAPADPVLARSAALVEGAQRP